MKKHRYYDKNKFIHLQLWEAFAKWHEYSTLPYIVQKIMEESGLTNLQLVQMISPLQYRLLIDAVPEKKPLTQREVVKAMIKDGTWPYGKKTKIVAIGKSHGWNGLSFYNKFRMAHLK